MFLKVGDFVILKDEINPPTKLPIGTVIMAEPSKDSVVRVITVKTPHLTFERHVTKTILLVRPPDTLVNESVVENPSVNVSATRTCLPKSPLSAAFAAASSKNTSCVLLGTQVRRVASQ